MINDKSSVERNRFKSKDYFKDEWEDVFQIDPSSQSGISWKISGINKEVGKPVGWLDKNNYWRCEYKAKAILVHRIIYHIQHGDLDNNMVVDHIDGNSLNNSVENLRMINYSENCRNRKKSKANVSGVNGVSESHLFIASWSQNGKSCSKSFNVLELGYLKAKELAEQYRVKKIQELNDAGYNYSERHGT